MEPADADPQATFMAAVEAGAAGGRSLVTVVLPTDGEPASALHAGPFAYTTGAFALAGCPELFVAGLDAASSGTLLDHLVAEMRRGVRFAEGVRYDGLLTGRLTVMCRVLTPAEKQAGGLYGLSAYYGTTAYERVPALQVYWPDPAGCYPWEPGFAGPLAGRQPFVEEGRAADTGRLEAVAESGLP